jgi:hypothetical protein
MLRVHLSEGEEATFFSYFILVLMYMSKTSQLSELPYLVEQVVALRAERGKNLDDLDHLTFGK